MNKNGFIQILIPLIIIAVIAFSGWYFLTTQKAQVKNISQSTSTSAVKEYTTQGGAIKIDFPKLSFSYPTGWLVNEDSTQGHDNITLTKNGYMIKLNQELRTGAGNCYFKDSPTMTELNSPGTDLQTVSYTEMDSNFGHLRYFRWIADNGTLENSYGFCERTNQRSPSGKDIYSVTSIGYLSLDIPTTQDTTTFVEALNIVKSIKPL